MDSKTLRIKFKVSKDIMKNHWLEGFKETQKVVKLCQVGIWQNGVYWGVQPLALDVLWEFHKEMNIGDGVWLIQDDLIHGFIPFKLKSLKVMQGDRLDVSFRDLKINGWKLSVLL